MNDSAPPADPSRVALAVRCVPDTLAADGLAMHQNFVTCEEAEAILSHVDAAPWDATLKRRTQHYGRRFDYRNKTAGDESSPLPACMAIIVDRLLAARPPIVPWPAGTTSDTVQVGGCRRGEGVPMGG